MGKCNKSASDRISEFESLCKANGVPIQLRDYVLLLKLDFDPENQIRVIKNILKLHQKTEEETNNDIERHSDFAQKCTGIRKKFELDDRDMEVHYSAFQSAALSMAAVGLLAPFFETVFTRCFLGIGNIFYNQLNDYPDNRKHHNKSNTEAWNCHKVVNSKKKRVGILKAVLQLSKATGLDCYLPEEAGKVLVALFEYRNAMFHNGFEWPSKECESFAKKIAKNGWPEAWFGDCSSNVRSKFFYMSQEFVDICLHLLEDVFDAFSKLTRREIGDKWPLVGISCDNGDV